MLKYTAMQKLKDWTLTDLPQNGFALVESFVSTPQLEQIESAISRLHQDTGAGMRHLLKRSMGVRRFARSEAMIKLASEALGGNAKPVKAILFDKTAATNWYVTWHQDLTIAVKERRDVEGFSTWSIKDGIDHVQPPAAVLSQIVALRVHLDPCPVDNGAIKFISGSHLSGVLEPAAIALLRDNQPHVVLPANKGDIIAMSPLVLHSSSQSSRPDHRRVLHIEYAACRLPGGLKFAEGSGLDSVELVMAIEEEFGIVIKDQHAEQLWTVGLTYDYLQTRLKESTQEGCLTQKIFYMLRRAIVANYKLSRHSIDLDTALDKLITYDELESGWPYLQLHTDLKVPTFDQIQKCIGFKLSTVTMRELVRQFVQLNSNTIFGDISFDDQIWQRLVKVIVDQTNCRIEEVTPEKFYSKDLGIC